MATKNAKGDAGSAQVQSKMDKLTEQGFRGVKVDPRPNEDYTVAGVTSGAGATEADDSIDTGFFSDQPSK